MENKKWIWFVTSGLLLLTMLSTSFLPHHQPLHESSSTYYVIWVALGGWLVVSSILIFRGVYFIIAMAFTTLGMFAAIVLWAMVESEINTFFDRSTAVSHICVVTQKDSGTTRQQPWFEISLAKCEPDFEFNRLRINFDCFNKAVVGQNINLQTRKGVFNEPWLSGCESAM